MRKLLLILFALFLSSVMFGQLSGSYNIPIDYASINAAFQALNAQGVASGGVTFNVNPGYTETSSDFLLLTASGKSGGPIVFQKAGSGTNPLVTRTGAGTLATTVLGGAGDAVIVLQGCDYVIFDGIDVKTENAGIEYGYYLRKGGVQDGCKNVTIKNAAITMTKSTTTALVVGIYSSNNVAGSSVGAITGVTVTHVDGRNENITFTGNTISNVATGILIYGFNHTTAPYQFFDQNFVVGANGAGNIIRNFGGGGTGAVYGVYARNLAGLNVSYNNINNSDGGVSATGQLNGINYVYETSNTNETGDFIANNNVLTFAQGSTSALNAIYTNQKCNSVTITGNTIGIGEFKSTSTSYLIYAIQSTNNVTVSYNSNVGPISKTGTSGILYVYYNNGTPTGGLETISNNNFSNISITGTSTLYGIYTSTSSTQERAIYGNIISGLTGGGSVYGLYCSSGSTNNVYQNQVSSLTGGSTIYGLYCSSGSTNNVYQNQVSSLTGGSTIYGLYSGGTSTGTTNTYLNTVNNLSSSGTSSHVYGIYAITAGTNSIYRNNVYNIVSSGSTGLVSGIFSSSGANLRFYNNFISDLKATASSAVNAINGINLNGGTNAGVYFNTVFLNATTTAATFGTSAIYAAVGVNLDLQNNILVNKSANAGTTGMTVAFRRNGATSPTNYLASSNKNDYFSGTPGAKNLIFHDGTNSYQTIGAFQAAMGSRDAGSFTEDPPFMDVTNSPYNLHLNTVQTKCESGGLTVGSPVDITTDFDDNPRFPNPNYPNDPDNPATAPDVGADEFAGIPVFTCQLPNPGNTGTTANNICFGQQITLSLQNPVTGTGNSIQWQESVDDITYSNILNATSATYTLVPVEPKYYRCVVTCQQTPPLSATSNSLLITFANEILTTKPDQRCGYGPVDLSATCNDGASMRWYAGPTGGAPLGTGANFTTPLISQTTTYYVGAETNVPGVATVGTGSTTSSVHSNPFYSSNSNTHNQHLIRAEELIAAGLVAGPISSLGLNISSIGTVEMLNLSLKIGFTSATTLQYWSTAAVTEVYTVANLMPVPGVNTMPFNDPVNWDGVSNLLIDICHDNTSSSASMSRTCRANTTSYISTIHANRTTLPSPSICPDTVTGRTTYTTRPQFIINGTVICSSPRTGVEATVTPPPVLEITADATICNDVVMPLTVLSPSTNFNVYEWSPVTNLYTDPGGTIPYTGGNALTVYFRSTTPGTTTYSCVATNNTTTCANIDMVAVTVLPSNLQISAIPPSLCVSGYSTLSVTIPSPVGAAAFQWQESLDGVTFSDISGATTLTYATPLVGITTHYRLVMRNGNGEICETPTYILNVSSPIATNPVPGFHCGPGHVVLAASNPLGGELKWYDTPALGDPIGTGSPFTTPYLWESKTFYVSAMEPGTLLESAGKMTPAGTSSNNTYTYGMVFTANDNIKLLSVNIYPTSTAGQITVGLYNSAGALIGGPLYFDFPAGNGTVPTTLPLDFQIVAGADYRLMITGRNGGSLRYEYASGGIGYPINNGTLVSLTGGALTLSGTPSAYYYNWFYDWRVMKGCAGPRVPVQATINLAPFYELTLPQGVCNDEVATLEVTNGTSYFDSFIWKPGNNLYTNKACTVPYDTLNSATTLYFKTNVAGKYQIRGYANNSVNGCTNFDTTAVVVLPTTLAITSDPDTICVSGSADLTLLPSMDYSGSIIQWQTSTNGTTFTNIPGATNQTYNTGDITSPTYYKVIIKNGSYDECLSAQHHLQVHSPVITGTTAGERCGAGTVNLGATGTGGIINWYGLPVGGAVLGSGPVFTTPVISTTTNFWASVSTGGTDAYVGMVESLNGTSGAGMNTFGIYFDALSAFTLKSVVVYPNSTIDGTVGTIGISVIDNNGVKLHETVVGVTGYNQSSNPNAQTVDLNFNIVPQNNLRLVVTTRSTGITGLMFQPSSQGPYPYPYTIPGVVSLTSSTLSTGVPRLDLYYYFYNWRISVGCESPRVQVVATVIPANPVNITPSRTICRDEVHTLSVTSNPGDYDEYTWTPTYDLYTDAACTLPYITGMNKSTVYFKSSNGIVTTYTCHALRIADDCNNSTTSTVTVIPDAVIVSSPDNLCFSGAATLSLLPSSGYGQATFQWQSSPDNIVFSIIEGATNNTYTTPVLAATTYYKAIIKNSAGNVCEEPDFTMVVFNPQILNTTSGSRCGPGTVQLAASVSPGYSLNWYNAGGTLVGTGSPFTTPVINLTTSFYAAASSGGSIGYVGMTGLGSNVSGTGGSTSSYLAFTAISDFNLKTVDIYPYGTGAGTVTIALKNSAGTTVLMTKTVNVTGTQSSTSPPQTVSLDFPITAGSYRLGVTGYTGAVTNMYRDYTGSTSVLFPYPYTVPGVVSITGNNLGNYYYYFYYNWQIQTGCESPRQEVLASVSPPPDLFISPSKTLCINDVYTVQVTSPLEQFDTYTWSPVDNLYTDAACTLPYVALANASTVYYKASAGSVTTYTCSASNTGGTFCTNLATTTITAIPAATIASTPEAICISGTSTLKLNPETGYGAATFQWQESPDNTVFTDIPGATGSTYLTTVLSSTRYYKVQIKNESGVICTEPVYTMMVNSPAVLSTTPGTRCGIGTVDLYATAEPGTTLNWYSAAIGGTKLGTGSQFTTPVINSTTSYYVAASLGGGGIGSVGAVTNSIGTGSAQSLTYYLIFDVLGAGMNLQGVYVYPGAAGDVKFQISNSSGTVLHSVVYPVTAGNVGNKTYIPVGFTVPNGTNYRMGYSSTVGGVSLFRNDAGAVYPYTLPGIVSITGHSFTGYPAYYYYFYDWQILTGCESPKVPVVATVTPPPAITASALPTQICVGNSSNLQVTSPNTNYTYSWMPGNLTGATQVVSPGVNTQYTVTASDAGTGCVNVATVAVSILPTPSPISVSPPSPVIMSGDIQPLAVTGGSLNGDAVFGTGTTVNTASGWPAPYTHWYGGNKHQMLIRASELTAQGLFPGANINTISFQVYAVGASFGGTLKDFRIDMGHTTNTVLSSSAFIGGLTTVSPAHDQTITVGTVTHTLTTPFIWNGTSNLVIQTTYSNNDLGTSSTCVQMYNTDVGFVGTNYVYSDNKAPEYFLTATTPTSSSTKRPNIILGFGLQTNLSWTPVNHLYIDAAATIPYTGGAQTTVYARPSSSIAYSVTSIATTTGCLSTGNVLVTVTSPCAMPTGLAVSEVTASMATLSWTAPSPAPGSGYEWEVRTSGDPGSGSVGLAADGTTFAGITTTQVSGLTPNTPYLAYVRSNCGDNVYSMWTVASTFTTCSAITALPYTENFDGTTIPNLPSCWTKYSSAAGTPWINTNQTVTPFTPAHSAPNYMYVTYNITMPKDEWLVSPAFDLSAGTSYRIKFWVDAPGYDPDPEKLKLVATTNPTLAGVSGGTVIWTRNDLMLPGYTAFSVIFTPASAGPWYFSWHAFSGPNVDYIAIDDVTVEIGGTPENNTVQNVTVTGVESVCFDATNTITVAGGGTTFVVQSGGSANFIAGQKISFLIGTTVQPGGYMHARIAPSGPFCSTSKIGEVPATPGEEIAATENIHFSLFPNPTNGNFTLVQKGDRSVSSVKVDIYTMNGEKVMTRSMVGRKHDFEFAGMPTGIYFVKVVADDYVETIKLVKTR